MSGPSKRQLTHHEHRVVAFITRRGLKLHRNVKWEAADYDVPVDQDGNTIQDREDAPDVETAEAVSSALTNGDGTRWRNDLPPEVWPHDLLLDLDVEAHLLPSSTEGHSHLYVALPGTPWGDVVEFLRAAVKIGLLEEGYVNACVARGATSLRMPGVRKGHEREAQP